MNRSRKVLLIGWDAADWKVINPLMDQGLMPNLSRMVENGTIGNLATLDPPLSPMLWTSIATGVRPYKHGITGFTELDEATKKIKPVTLRNRKVKAIWNILSESGYKTHVVGWWPSHPAEAINGIMVSNFYQRAARPISEPWLMKPGTIYPENKSGLFGTMRIHPGELTENHISAFVPQIGKVDQKKEKGLQALARIIADNATVHAAATYILEFEKWDFAAVYYDGIDHFNHAFMKFHPPRQKHINENSFELYKEVVTGGYRFHDMMLGRLLQLAGDEALVILISDHGFHPDHLRKIMLHRDLAGPAEEHSRYGIICAKGPGIKKDELIYGAGLLDITPTLLTVFGLPVAEDMDGKPLLSLFENEPEIRRIPSWNNNYTRAGESQPFGESDQEALKQLIDLGYIENIHENPENAFADLTIENKYFLARAYMDGGKFAEAKKLLIELMEQRPWEIRIVSLLCQCYQRMLEFDQVKHTIESYHDAALKKQKQLEEESKQKEIKFKKSDIQPGLNLMYASMYIAQQLPDKALHFLQKVQSSGFTGKKLNLRIGNCYAVKKQWQSAMDYYRKEIEINFDDPEAHYGLGFASLKSGNAAGAVEHFLDAVGLQFDFAFAHYHLGEAFLKLSDWQNALRAYEVCLRQEPGINKARNRIALIYREKLRQPDKAIPYEKSIPENLNEVIYIVSGLPRSGTSMLMRMLEQGGMELFEDRKRSPDLSNPHGYFEHHAVKNIANDSRWLEQAVGKAIKIVTPLIPFLPLRFRYKIIFAVRDLDEIMLSQQHMLRHSGKKDKLEFSVKIRQSYESMHQRALDWCNRNQSNVRFLMVHYGDVVRNPLNSVRSISGFLDIPVDPEKMIKAIDPALYRSKLTEKITE